MKQYTQLLSFGCSFTQGGGLNSSKYHAGTKTNEEATEYGFYHSYPGYLGRLLNCKTINYGHGSAANEFILKNVYDVCNTIRDEERINTLVTVQTSILSRMFIYDALDGCKEYTINNPTMHDERISRYYTSWITNFFDPVIEFKKLLMNVTLLQSWLREKNIDFLFVAWEKQGSTNNLFYNFPDTTLGGMMEYVLKNKLLLLDVPDIPFKDFHVTEKGNEIVANLLYDYLKRTV